MSFYVDKNELEDLCRMAKRLKGFYVDMTPPPDAVGDPPDATRDVDINAQIHFCQPKWPP